MSIASWPGLLFRRVRLCHLPSLLHCHSYEYKLPTRTLRSFLVKLFATMPSPHRLPQLLLLSRFRRLCLLLLNFDEVTVYCSTCQYTIHTCKRFARVCSIKSISWRSLSESIYLKNFTELNYIKGTYVKCSKSDFTGFYDLRTGSRFRSQFKQSTILYNVQ